MGDQYSIEQALRAQQALREAAGLAPERFPIGAVVGMVSDEIETLRSQGWTDEEIAEMIRRSSSICISADEVGEFYAPAGQRRGGGD